MPLFFPPNTAFRATLLATAVTLGPIGAAFADKSNQLTQHFARMAGDMPKPLGYKDAGRHVQFFHCLENITFHPGKGLQRPDRIDPTILDEIAIARRKYGLTGPLQLDEELMGASLARETRLNKCTVEFAALMPAPRKTLGAKKPADQADGGKSIGPNKVRRLTKTEARAQALARAKRVQQQVLMQHAGISIGEIDGVKGTNMSKGLADYKRLTGTDLAQLDINDLAQLMADTGGLAVRQVTLTAADIKGPYFPAMPRSTMGKLGYPVVGYRSVTEKLGEKFQMSPALLTRLNPRSDFTVGEKITVVRLAKTAKRTSSNLTIYVDIEREVLVVTENRKLLARYPVTINPLRTPDGTLTVTTNIKNPNYTHRPKGASQVVVIQPGPNNPVGSVWIGLNKPGYGIHGSPDPRTISKTTSAGCIRLVNHDALRLSNLIKGAQVTVHMQTPPESVWKRAS